MSLLTHALTLGLATASISAFGRRRRMVIVFDVTHALYHALPGRAIGFSDGVGSIRYRQGLCSTAAQARRKYSSNCHSPLLPVWRVTTRSKLGTKEMYCPPEPGLARASAGMPLPLRPPSPVRRAGSSQPWEKICGLSFHRISGLFTSWVGTAVSSTNHFGTTCVPFHRPPRSMQ